MEPWGPERLERSLAVLTAVVANIARGKGQRAYKAEDFLPRYGPRRVLSSEELLERVRYINAALGGEDKTGERS